MDEKSHFLITITWIPGHSEIEGNERADFEAKKTARDPTMSKLFRHRLLKSARIRRIKADAKRQWAEHWKNAKTAHNLRCMLK
jgi:hypothetical protein